ncbi:MAG: hypothetical protein ACO3K9_01730 [Paracoccaceae bacterium]|jgi:hypothetical protein|nr:hypothetical protein [Paracoccaceae bacterium]MDA0319259.1 hypothetical protein [Pseudomonadota bacterium]MDA0851243.1 hypothetical protein [Pseudomonadota bacterium]MDA1295031.1 hypothetical protein [Pseudomonadota bacterium]
MGGQAIPESGPKPMIPHEGYKRLMPRHEVCDCEVCATNQLDWSKLSNTEKMVKAMILKAQFAAELNRLFD